MFTSILHDLSRQAERSGSSTRQCRRCNHMHTSRASVCSLESADSGSRYRYAVLILWCVENSTPTIAGI